MFEKYSAEARRVVVLAQEEARALSHNFIGPEHLLISLTRDAGVAGQALTSLGVTTAAAQGNVADFLGLGPAAPGGHIPFTPAARTVMEGAVTLHGKLFHGDDQVKPEHLLLSLLSVGGIVPELYVHLGTTAEDIVGRAAMLMVLAAEPARPSGPFTFDVHVDSHGTVHLDAAAAALASPDGSVRRAQFTLQAGEFFSMVRHFGGPIDENVRQLDFATARAIATECGCSVVIMTSRTQDVTAVAADGTFVTIGETTVWSASPIAQRLVFLD